MIRRLTEYDHETCFSFLKQQPAENLFIIGDIEAYGYEKDFQKVWGEFNNVEIMGRITSVIGVIQSLAQIIFLLGIGVLGDIFPLRYTIVILACFNMILSLNVCWQLLKPGKQQYFSETSSETANY
jgi:hypothetical protein